MAIDSRNKRAAVVGLPWMPFFSVPDGSVNAGDRIVCAVNYALPGWSSADTVEDEYGPGYWNDVNNAKDGDTATYAEEATASALRTLLFTYNSPLPVTQILRWYLTDSGGGNPTIDVSYRQNSDEVFNKIINDSAATKDQWVEYPIATGSSYKNVYQIRIESADAANQLRVHEVQVLNLRGIVQVGARPNLGGDLTKSAVLGSGLIG